MRSGREGSGAGAPLVPLAEADALRCRGADKPIRYPFEPIIILPPLPAPPVLVPLPDAGALDCLGGEDPIRDVRALIDWITGTPPDPGTWPPGPGSAG